MTHRRMLHWAVTVWCAYEAAALASDCKLPPLSWLCWRSRTITAIILAGLTLHFVLVPPEHRKATPQP